MNKRAVLRSRRGFSLVEVLIGMVILMIALASAAALSFSNAQLVAKNQFSVHAANLAETKMEQLRNTSYSLVVTGADATSLTSLAGANGPFTRSWTVFPNTPATNLKTVIVTVGWSQSGIAQSYVLQGVIGQ